MANIPAGDLHDYQADILYNSDTATNPKLPYSAIPAINKSLKTVQKRPIRAINEVYDAVKQNNDTVSAMSGTMTQVLGNVSSNPQLLTDLNKIAPDAISAIILLYKMMAGPDLDAPIDISNFATSLHEAITKLQSGAGTGGSGGNDGSFLLSL